MEHTELTLGQIANYIKENVSMTDVAEHYGLKVNRSGFAPCPFHGDTHPSMKIYPGNKGFCCFACGANGDVVKFVQSLLHYNFRDTLQEMITVFNLPIAFGSVSKEKQAEMNRRIANLERERLKKRTEQESRINYYENLYDLFVALDIILLKGNPASDEYAIACRNIDYVWEKLKDAESALCTT